MSVPPPFGPMEFDPARVRSAPAADGVSPAAEAGPQALEPPAELLPQGRRTPMLALALAGLGVLLVLGLGLQAYGLVLGLFALAPALGWFGLGVLALTALALVLGVIREVMALRRLRHLGDLRQDAAAVYRREAYGEADDLLRELPRLYADRPGLRAAQRRFAAEDRDDLSDGERLRLFAQVMLEPLDGAANQQIIRAARDVSALTALAPLGLLDSLIVLLRTVMMLRRIAQLYGVRPGIAASLDLLRLSARNAALAGVGDVMSHALGEALHGSLLRMVSTKAGQGAVNGLLVARLGIACMQACRPLPFEPGRAPSLSGLRDELLRRLAGT